MYLDDGRLPAADSPALADDSRTMGVVFPAGCTVFTGYYGSGKTEVAANLALELAGVGETVHLIDLDFLKPCFRSRELADVFERRGVDLVAPRGSLARADLPVVMGAVMPLLAGHRPGRVLVDLAGDPGGARAIAQFARVLAETPHDLVLVVNTLRPFASSVERILQAKAELETVTRLSITALVANTNLGGETRPDMVRDGFRLAREAATRAGVPLRGVMAPDFLRASLDPVEFDAPLAWLHRYVLPPWEGEPIGTEGS